MKNVKNWFFENKATIIFSTLLAILELVLFVFPVGWGYHYKKLLVVLIGMTWLGMLVRVPDKLKLPLGILLAALMPAVLITWLEKMTETITFVEDAAHPYNILLAYVLELIVLLFTLSLRVGIISTAGFLTLIYTVNYFVYLYRGKAFSFNDILAFKTAARVVGNYDLTPSNIMVVAWSFFLLFVVLTVKVNKTLPEKLGKTQYSYREWILRSILQ